MMIVGASSREIIREIREVTVQVPVPMPPEPRVDPPPAHSLVPLIWTIIILQVIQISMSFLK